MMVGSNGPEVFKCNSVVVEVIEFYWSKAKRENEKQVGHFVRKLGTVTKFVASAAVDSMTSFVPKGKFLM